MSNFKLLIAIILALNSTVALKANENASEITPPETMRGKTSDKGPMVWDWKTVKEIFGKK